MRVSKIEREKDFEFPVIMENQRYGTLVLATGWHGPNHHTFQGTCIRVGDSNNTLGDDKTYWSTEAFTVFRGKLVIEQ